MLYRCKQEALRVFYDALKENGDKLQQFPPSSSTPNLAPPHEIYEAINQLVKASSHGMRAATANKQST
jgi:hypothetical protein